MKTRALVQLQRFAAEHKKLLSMLAGSIILAMVLITIAVNGFLFASHSAVSRAVNAELRYGVSIGRIYYLFPNTIVLKDLAVAPRTDPGQRAVYIPRISAKFSLLNLLFQRKICVTMIAIPSPEITWMNFCEFLREDFKNLIEIIKQLPKENIKVTVNKALIKLAKKNYGPESLTVDSVFTTDGDSVFVTGSLDAQDSAQSFPQKQKANENPLLKYGFKGTWTPQKFYIHTAVISGENLYSKLWGSFKKDVLYLNGFSLLNTRAERINSDKNEKSLNVIERVKFFLRVLKGGSLPADELTDRNIYLTNLDCAIKMAFPEIQIQHFDVNYNMAPIDIKGRIVLREPPTFDLKGAFYPALARDNLAGDLAQTNIDIMGKLDNDAFFVNSKLHFLFKDKKTSIGSLEFIDIELSDFIFDFYNYPHLKVAFSKGGTNWSINSNEHRISLSDLSASLDFGTESLKKITVNASAYEGKVDGMVWLDTAETPFRISSEAKLHDLDANQLTELLVHFSKLHGRLDGDVFFYSHPQLDLKGEINVRNGKLKNYEFFKWLAESFGLISLLDIDFDKVNTKFSVVPNYAGIYDIDLQADDIKIAGDFYLKDNNLVTSKLSLALSPELIKESRNFKPVLKFFDKDIPALDLDFQLSGPLDALNFKWLSNWTKERIRSRIPDFIERIIERQVDRGLAHKEAK